MSCSCGFQRRISPLKSVLRRAQELVLALGLIQALSLPSFTFGGGQGQTLLLGKQRAISSAPLPRGKYLDVLQRNLNWFRDSGVLLGPDASQGVAERIILIPDNPQVADIENTFTGLRRQGKYLHSEMRRPDCNFESALAFFYAQHLLGGDAFARNWKNILGYLRNSRLQVLDPKVPEYGLWTWSSHTAASYWSDDNTWNTILPLKFYLLTGDEEWLRRGLLTARGLLRYGKLLGDPAGSLHGRPHWGGMRAMGLAYAYALTQDPELRAAALEYLHSDYRGLILDANGKPTKRPFTTSESSYFLLESSLIYAATRDSIALECVNLFGDYLISRQGASGTIPGETRWGAAGDHVVDLIYTQNWFTLAMWHAFRVTDNAAYKQAFMQSLNFLVEIQDKGPDPQTNGSWRGAFDTLTWEWGGTNQLEGGPGSIYTGWTNAPMDLCIEFDLTGDSLLPPQLSETQQKAIQAVWTSIR